MFEKDLPGRNTTGFGGAVISSLPLETCETMNDSWGFNITDRNYKTVKQLIHYIINAAGRNANFLLNIGPMPNGNIQKEFTDTLQAIGKWIQQNGETIYGTRGNLIDAQEWGVATAKNKTIYLHVLNNPVQNWLLVSGVKEKITACKLFANKTPLKFKQQEEGVFVYLPQMNADAIDNIIELTVK